MYVISKKNCKLGLFTFIYNKFVETEICSNYQTTIIEINKRNKYAVLTRTYCRSVSISSTITLHIL